MNVYDGYKDLATAIVVQAIKDFKDSAISYKKGRNKELASKAMNEVINFIKSDWYLQLSSVNPEFLIDKLREELEDDS